MWLVKRNYGFDDYPRLVNRFFNELNENWPYPEDDSVAWTPRMDVKETDKGYEIHADLPGLDKKDISVSLNDNVLTIKGERKHEKKEDSQQHFHLERAYGQFSRSFTLPEKVNEKDIKAHYKDGVLFVSLVKAEEAKPKEIEIS